MPDDRRGSCPIHPNNRAVAYCERCGMPLCYVCDNMVAGRHYCREHADQTSRNRRSPAYAEPERVEYSPRSQLVAAVLAVIGGFVGLHRFYLGRWKSGLCQFFLFAIAISSANRLSYFSTPEHRPLMWFLGFFLSFGVLDTVFILFGGAFIYSRRPTPFVKFSSSHLFRTMNLFLKASRASSTRNQIVDAWLSIVLLIGCVVITSAYALASPAWSNAEVPGFAFFALTSSASGIWLAKDAVRLYHNDLLDGYGRLPS